MDTEVFEINTKGVCVLCLKDCIAFDSGASMDRGNASFNAFLRYLQVDIMQLGNFSSTKALPSLEESNNVSNVDVRVTLCQDCSVTSHHFCEVQEQLERLQKERDECVRSMFCVLKGGQANDTGGDEGEEQQRYFQSRLRTKNPLDMFYATVADNLRSETMTKCGLQLESQGLQIVEDISGMELMIVSTSTVPPPKAEPCPSSIVEATKEPVISPKLAPSINSPPPTTEPTPTLPQTPSVTHYGENYTFVSNIVTSPGNPRNPSSGPHESTFKPTVNNDKVQEKVDKRTADPSAEHYDIIDWSQTQPSKSLNITIGPASKVRSKKKDLNRTLPNAKSNSETVNYDCFVCGQRFTRKEDMIKHKKSMHPHPEVEANGGEWPTDPRLNSKTPNRCTFCLKGFDTPQGCIAHTHSVHLTELVSKRLHLPSRTTSTNQVKSAIDVVFKQMYKRKPNTDPKSPYGCPYCRDTLGTVSSLRAHVLRSHLHNFSGDVREQLAISQSQPQPLMSSLLVPPPSTQSGWSIGWDFSYAQPYPQTSTPMGPPMTQSSMFVENGEIWQPRLY